MNIYGNINHNSFDQNRSCGTNWKDLMDVISNNSVSNTNPVEIPPPQLIPESSDIRQTAYVRIVEQPFSPYRFRYKSEGNKTGPLPGVNSTEESKTFPTIEVVGYEGKAVVMVSCVTRDCDDYGRYKPHPHSLVGKEGGCKKNSGACFMQVTLGKDGTQVIFNDLGIQCVKIKDVHSALKAREELNIDPFKTKNCKRQSGKMEMNVIRLCFQVIVKDREGRKISLKPVVSDPIIDKKSLCKLSISSLSSCSSPVFGGKEIILLCEKIVKEDIEVVFFESKTGWEGIGDFRATDVHKNYAIKFRTPPYRNLNINEPVQVSIVLRRPSHEATSTPLEFQYFPASKGLQVHQRSEHLPRLYPQIFESPNIFLHDQSLTNDLGNSFETISPINDLRGLGAASNILPFNNIFLQDQHNPVKNEEMNEINLINAEDDAATLSDLMDIDSDRLILNSAELMRSLLLT
ncbi:dl family protein [Megaselia abdita]